MRQRIVQLKDLAIAERARQLGNPAGPLGVAIGNYMYAVNGALDAAAFPGGDVAIRRRSSRLLGENTMRIVSLVAAAKIWFLILLTQTAVVGAAEIKVLSANGARLIVEALAPPFEHATNNKVTISYGEAGILRKRILDGEAFDVTFLPSGWDEVRGKIVGDPVGIGHTDLGMAVLAGVPKPDTSSNDALKRTLLAAKSIVYTDPKTGGISGVLFARMIERLGIADEINKKSKLVAGVLNATFVVKGEVDLAVQLANEILAVPGAQFVPMSPEFHASVTFSGAVAASAKEPAVAKAMLQFFTAPSAAPVIRSKGYEPG